MTNKPKQLTATITLHGVQAPKRRGLLWWARRILAAAVAAWLVASLGISIAYNRELVKGSGRAWDIASQRDGLLVADVSGGELWLLNPATNDADDWFIGFTPEGVAY